MEKKLRIVTSESVNIGHPDKTCDVIADSFLDEALRQDKDSQMAVECAIKNEYLFIYGEATTKAKIDYEGIARKVLKEIGYKLLGVFTVGIPYLIWLVTAGILDDFLDLAILGMFDFAEKNTSGSFANCVFFVNIVVIYATFLIFKYCKENGERNKNWLIMRNVCDCIINICYSNI